MKFITSLTTGFVSMGLLVAAFAETPAQNPIKFELPQVGSSTTPATAPVGTVPSVAPVKYSQSQLMEYYGYLMAVKGNLGDLEFTAADIDSMAKGQKMALANEAPPASGEAIAAQLKDLFSQKDQVFLKKLHAQNVAETTVFFAKLKENKAVQVLPSGLCYEVVKAANGPTVKLGQVAKFHFTLKSLSGKVVDSSAGREPMEAVIREGGMIPGMVEGLQKIPVGAKYTLYVPYALAYGDKGAQGIPPATSLVFEVEMIDVKDAPPEAAPAAAK